MNLFHLIIVSFLFLSLPDSGCAGNESPHSFAAQVEKLRGLDADSTQKLNALINKAALLAQEPVWARSGDIEEMTGGPKVKNGVNVKFYDLSSKYYTVVDRIGEECAVMYGLACNDIGISDFILNELPYMAAAYRLSPAPELKSRITNQLRELTEWIPFQRQGWILPHLPAGHPWLSTNVNDGIYLATANLIQAIVLSLDILPADFFAGDEVLRTDLLNRIRTEVELTHHDWVNAIPDFVQKPLYQSNKWIVPLSGMMIGAAYLGDMQAVYEYGVEQLLPSIDTIGADGSMSEGFGYGLSRSTSSLLLCKRMMEMNGDNRFSNSGNLINIAKWAVLGFQPGGNVVNAFDWYSGQRLYGITSVHETITQLAAITSDDIYFWILKNMYTDPSPTLFGMLSLSGISTAAAAMRVIIMTIWTAVI
ncbi:MAG: hypothetical protein WC959_11780 [Kiritimatiellales bacterium]